MNVLVVGDFFLDKYLVIERSLAELSLETGLEAHQVVEVRTSPGAAGTVTNNLRAMGLGVTACGVIGDDGEGYELRRGLTNTGVNVDGLVVGEDCFTPTYTKPMLREQGGAVHELNRLDIKNRRRLPEKAEDEVIRRLRELLAPDPLPNPPPQGEGIKAPLPPHTCPLHAVIISDQVQEPNCGVITERVRDELMMLACSHPEIPFVVDSRERIGLFRGTLIKPNAREAVRAVDPGARWRGDPDPDYDLDGDLVRSAGQQLHARTGRPLFLTLGNRGMLVYEEGSATLVPALRANGPIDIVGSGDAAMAGITAALCTGATPAEAAQVGCLAAGVTVRQIGTTGTASVGQMLDLWHEPQAK